MNMKEKKLRKGILIAIEGIDGAGKTTQANLLKEILVKEGYPVTLLHEPTEGKWGKKMKDLASRRHNVDVKIEYELFMMPFFYLRL